MTAVSSAPVGPSADAASTMDTIRAAGAGKRVRRWHRLALPFLVLVLVYLVTGIAHVIEEPDLGDAGTLSPAGTGPDGSNRLAELLAARGVTTRQVLSSTEAMRTLAEARGSTVFVPAPDLIDPRFFDAVRADQGGNRLVLVRPGARTALSSGLGFVPGSSRWAARAVPPNCDTDFALRAGPAAVLRTRYEIDATYPGYRCYDGGLIGYVSGGMETVVVGATDPFRNSRLDEVGNAALATALLDQGRPLVWLDVHKSERADDRTPPLDDESAGGPYQDGSSGNGSSRGNGSAGDDEAGDSGPGPGPAPDDDSNPLWSAFPPVLWASLALLFVVALLIALVRGRRLGPPVAEPLPVVVPATETVTGRGRLYERIASRRESLDTLRAAAIRRMAPTVSPYGGVGLGGDSGGDGSTPDTVLVEQLATRLRVSPDEVHAILYGPAPENDEELLIAVARLDELVNAVLRVGPRRDDDTGRPGDRGRPAGAAGPAGEVHGFHDNGGTL